jgi:putative spermidine/putrescine transport system substrate-binding protein
MRRTRTRQSCGWNTSIQRRRSACWLKGYCHPARFNAMAAAGKIPQELLDALPPAAAYEAAYFPTLEEVDANKAAVTGGWDAVVGANVE